MEAGHLPVAVTSLGDDGGGAADNRRQQALEHCLP